VIYGCIVTTRAVPGGGRGGLGSCPGRAKQRSKGRAGPRQKKALQRAYTELITIAQTSVAQARQVRQALGRVRDAGAQQLARAVGSFLPLVEQAIGQAVRRVFYNQSLPAQEKVVSLCEPHTQIIRRGKPGPRETEFGHKVNYAEVEGGFISDWQLIATGNPPDEQLLPEILHHHCSRFGHAPRLLAGDQGLFSPANERLAQRLGVRQIAIPQPGSKTAQRQAHEKQAWFKHGQRFRNGIEGRISVVRRTVQLARCPNHGLEGFERWIGWGIIVANLVVLARRRLKRRCRHKH
jgi:transposase, IS5 family